MAGDHALRFEFVSEAKEHLANVTDDLLALEKGPADAAPYRIDRLFRAAHSIKGGAGFVGLRQVAELAHGMEALLDRCRQGRQAPPGPVVEALLAAADRIHALLDDVGHSDEADIRELRDRLTALLGGPPPVAAARRPEDLGFELTPALRDRLAAYPFLYAFQTDLTELLQRHALTPLQMVEGLLRAGEILDARLETAATLAEGPLDGPLRYAALVASALEPDALVRAAGLPADHFQPVERPRPEALPAVLAPAQAAPPAAEADAGRVNTVRIAVDLLDRLMTLAGELVLIRNQALVAVPQSDPPVRRLVQRLNAATTAMQEAVMLTRLQPVGNLFGKFPRVVRDLARQLGKQIDIEINGQEVELDKTLLETLTDPLTHLIRNSCDHGIEPPDVRARSGKPPVGRVFLQAAHEGGQIHIQITDDGKGIDPAALRRKALQLGLKTKAELTIMDDRASLGLILLPGFSTAEQVTDVSGRGVGMDVVKTNLDKIGGALEIESLPGLGTTFHLRLPLTVAIIPVLMVRCGGERYAIPQKDLEELVCLHPGQAAARLEHAHDQEFLRRRRQLLPLVRLDEVLARPQPFTAATRMEIARAGRAAAAPLTFVAVVKAGRARFGLVVDEVLTTEEIVVKPMHGTLQRLKCFAGATILGDGRVALILDIEGIARHAGTAAVPVPAEAEEPASVRERQTVLLFQAGPQEQFGVDLTMVRRLELIPAARLERVGDQAFVTLDGVTTRVVRLEEFLPVSPLPPAEQLYLLLPRHVRRPFAVAVARLVDTVTLTLDLRPLGRGDELLLGSAEVRGKLTLFPDLFRLADRLGGGEAARTATGRGKVLLVEDTKFFRQLVKGYLEAAGYDVVTAMHGAQGLEQLDEHPFDLVISDIEMPVMDGWSFARQVRQRPEQNNLPLLALTTLAGAEDREKSLAAGFNSHEVKVDRERLLAQVARLLQARRGEGR